METHIRFVPVALGLMFASFLLLIYRTPIIQGCEEKSQEKVINVP